MKSPFPGMDPYLEAPDLWRGLHTRLITYIADSLQPQLVPRYVAMVEDRVTVEPRGQARWPDASVREPQASAGVAVVVRPLRAEVTLPEEIEAPELALPQRMMAIRDPQDRTLITALELLSPWNKVGDGLAEYRQKQRQYLHSTANLVEIDLLRRGRHAVAVPRERLPRSDYRMCIHRAGSSRFQVLRFGVRDALPVAGIPLGDEDPDVVLDLGAVFVQAYERGAYQYVLNYGKEPDPPLKPEDQEWARERIRDWRAGGDL